jgi:DNA-binding MarR family transcriptional regulator
MRESGEHEGIMSQPGARLVLSLLAISDGRSQRELAELTRLRPPTVSVILRRMADEGMVEIKSSESDMRVKYVYLTEHGKMTDKANIEKIKATDAKGLGGLSDEENETLMRLLGKIRDNLLAEEK